MKTYTEAMKQCQSYVTASKICQAHDPKTRKPDKKDLGPSNHSSRNKEEYSSRDKNYQPRRPNPPSDMGPLRSRHLNATEGEPKARNMLDGGNDPMFNRNKKDIFFAIRDELSAPPLTTTPFDRRNYNMWCDYHKEHGHTLSQCREFKRVLHQLVEEGKLGRFMIQKEYDTRNNAERRPWHPRHRSPRREEARIRESSNTQGTINMIFGGYFEEYPTIRAVRNSVHTLLKGPSKTTSGGPSRSSTPILLNHYNNHTLILWLLQLR